MNNGVDNSLYLSPKNNVNLAPPTQKTNIPNIIRNPIPVFF